MSCHSPFKNSERMCAVIISREFAQYLFLVVDGDAASHFGLILFLLARVLACRRNAMERRGDCQLIESVGCLVGGIEPVE